MNSRCLRGSGGACAERDLRLAERPWLSHGRSPEGLLLFAGRNRLRRERPCCREQGSVQDPTSPRSATKTPAPPTGTRQDGPSGQRLPTAQQKVEQGSLRDRTQRRSSIHVWCRQIGRAS